LTDVPRTPSAFFESYVPAHIARLGGAFAGRSSPGAITFDIGGVGAWSLRLRDGAIEVQPGAASDALFRVTVPAEDFEPVLVAGAERLGEDAGLERQLVAVRALVLDDERVRMLREVSGRSSSGSAEPPGSTA
jgi:hypothetical protein